MSYRLIIGTIDSIEPINGADRIVAATIFGKTIVVGKDTSIGDIMCYADTDGIFEDEFCRINNLFPIKDENGKKIGGGFFTPGKAKIRAQSFKGVKSNGFAFPISYLSYTKYDLSTLKVGDQFDELNGVKICSKYISPATLRALNAKNKVKAVKKTITFCFPEHVDSEQFKYKSDSIKIGDLITISEKYHGCVEKSTIIETLEYGKITIGEIVEKRLLCNVLARDIEQNKDVYVPIDDYYFYADSEDWYELELEDGTKLEITGNNPVWLENVQAYRRADKLQEGDLVLCQ